MHPLAAAFGLLLIALILWDTFETILLPRRVSGTFKLTLIVQRGTWKLWSGAARGIRTRHTRENVLALYAMLTMLLLFFIWAAGLILAFGLLHWSLSSPLAAAHGTRGLWTDLYMSGTTFFTLGLGDVSPLTAMARALTVMEAGTGFGFLALVLAYLPVLYQAFSRREAHITMLDEWAGSPPSAVEMLQRCGESGDPSVIVPFLRDWELWSADLMETHLSYPILAYFRSQHDNQSWLSALTTVLDACALVMVGVDRIPPWQARLTFALARHTVVDLTQVYHRPPRPFPSDRLPPDQLAKLRETLAAAGVPLRAGADADARLAELRAMYEPYVHALSDHLLMPTPSWLPDTRRRYNWQTTAWERT